MSGVKNQYFSRVHYSMSENADVINSVDEIYLVFYRKKVPVNFLLKCILSQRRFTESKTYLFSLSFLVLFDFFSVWKQYLHLGNGLE